MTTWLTSNVKYEYISRVSWSDAAAAKTLSWHYLQGILTLILQYYIRILASVACVVLCLEFLWNMEIGTMINQKYICRMRMIQTFTKSYSLRWFLFKYSSAKFFKFLFSWRVKKKFYSQTRCMEIRISTMWTILELYFVPFL